MYRQEQRGSARCAEGGKLGGLAGGVGGLGKRDARGGLPAWAVGGPSAVRLLHMVREWGYCGGPSHFRALIGRLRPHRAAAAHLRRRTLPGEEAQVDWASFGKMASFWARRRACFSAVMS
jgi:hypothetical protein